MKEDERITKIHLWSVIRPRLFPMVDRMLHFLLNSYLRRESLTMIKLTYVWLCVCGLTLLIACSGKTAVWKEELRVAIAGTDSTAFTFRQQLDSTELHHLIGASETIYSSVKTAVSGDTLSIDFAQLLDAFVAAYHNAETLETEYVQCKLANEQLNLRLKNLQQDILNGVGDRTGYCSAVTREKGELTKIRNHCKDIQRRFEALKRAKEQFEPALLRYMS